MKKLGIIAPVALALTLTANAYALPAVKTLDATADGAEISYSGTIEDGSYAAMCKLYSNGEEVDMLSTEVDGGAFSGSFTAPTAGDYTVYCANYEGGDILSAEVTTEEGAEEITDGAAEEVETPKTFDAGIVGAVASLCVVVTALGSTIWLSRKK